MTHGSLFSGIGGFDLAAEWMGWENMFHCEREPFAQTVLKHHFPNSKLYDDITTFDATAYAGRIDILTGGFPCQPFSTAGKRLGKEDERHLWPSMLRIIREVAPRYVVGENVRGLLNWSGGMVFEEVCADLEAQGYEVAPYILPACSKNAPHRRDRIWFVAYANNRLCKQSNKEVRTGGNTFNSSNKGSTSNTSKKRLYTSKTVGELGRERLGGSDKSGEYWENFPTEPAICGGDDGFSKGLDGITFSKWRTESIKAYGNAIVPQVAHEIFKAIQKIEDEKKEEELKIITQAQ